MTTGEQTRASSHTADSRGESGGPIVLEGVLEVSGPVGLHHGGSLPGLRVGWRLAGPTSAPIVAALGGISAHRRVCSTEHPDTGWWSEIVGQGLALPSDQFRILSFDYLGGSGETTGPRDGQEFPSVSSYDQAQVLLRLLDHLEIPSLRAIVGASYGGMVALAFGERFPDRVRQLVVISAADRTNPMSTAWRSVQRRMVRFGIESGQPARGLELARALAMATYRSVEEFSARFSGLPERREGRFVFPVEDYLLARGTDYARRYQPDAFLTLSESIDLHRVDATRITVPVVAVAVRQDQLVPVADMRAMCERLPNAQCHEISSVFGHDAFLKEAHELGLIFSAALKSDL